MKKPSASVLLIEDDPDQALIVAGFLSRLGFVVTSCADAEQAITRLEEERPEIVLSDINLPGMGGLDLLREIRRKHRGSAVILLTGYGTIESAIESLRLGASDYLIKPVVDAELRLSLKRALAQRELLATTQQVMYYRE